MNNHLIYKLKKLPPEQVITAGELLIILQEIEDFKDKVSNGIYKAEMSRLKTGIQSTMYYHNKEHET